MQIPRSHTTYNGAIALLDRLPARGCAANSQAIYARNFRKMWFELVLDALRPGDARDTYGVRRAAMYWGSRELLVRLLKKFQAAAETGARDFGRRLLRILARVMVDPAQFRQAEGSRKQAACAVGAAGRLARASSDGADRGLPAPGADCSAITLSLPSVRGRAGSETRRLLAGRGRYPTWPAVEAGCRPAQDARRQIRQCSVRDNGRYRRVGPGGRMPCGSLQTERRPVHCECRRSRFAQVLFSATWTAPLSWRTEPQRLRLSRTAPG
jgi:hypothetical protein